MSRKVALLAALVLAGSSLIGTSYAADSDDAGSFAGSFMVRLRGIGVLPDERSTVSAIGGKVDASNTVVPELDFSYFISDNIAVELIAAVTKHTATDVASSAGDVPLGSVWLLPPTLTAQYHFHATKTFDPYIGAGLNYTTMFSVKKPATGPVTSIHYGDSVGPALQAGADYALSEHWVANIDLKKIWIKSNVSINGGGITAKVHLDPWIVGAGVGYRF